MTGNNLGKGENVIKSFLKDAIKEADKLYEEKEELKQKNQELIEYGRELLEYINFPHKHHKSIFDAVVCFKDKKGDVE